MLGKRGAWEAAGRAGQSVRLFSPLMRPVKAAKKGSDIPTLLETNKIVFQLLQAWQNKLTLQSIQTPCHTFSTHPSASTALAPRQRVTPFPLNTNKKQRHKTTTKTRAHEHQENARRVHLHSVSGNIRNMRWKSRYCPNMWHVDLKSPQKGFRI